MLAKKTAGVHAMKAILRYKNKKFGVENIKRIKSRWGMAWGLMFKPENTNALLFEFEKPTRMGIHSFFVFFPFIAVWLDDKNKIVEQKIVQPFTPSIKPAREFVKLLEIPLNNNYSTAIKILVGK
jgi:uncharacterized membrane protein (UPF0127 family)